MKVVRYATLALGALFLSATLAQQPDPTASKPFGLAPGTYAVGFRLLEGQDDTRAIAGGANSNLHARPIRTYLWYPAARTGRPMRFARYASLADEDIWPAEIAGSLREELTFSRRPLARSLGSAGFEALLQQPVLAVENAKPLGGPFPLVVIALGWAYESPTAFAALGEYLAGRGFAVATAPFFGTSSPLVRVDLQDLETQVRDLEFVIAQARRLPFVSPERLGVFGFDQGGMAGLILAMSNPDVDAFASMDAGILHPHPSGLPRSSPHYDRFALRIPWLHGMGNLDPNQPADSENETLFDQAPYSNRYRLVAQGLPHADFTSYALIEGRRALPGYWADATPEVAHRHAIVVEYVYNFFAAFLRQNAESLVFLSRDPKEAFPGSNMRIEHREATSASISYADFVQAAVAGRAEEAIDELRSIAAVEPDHILLNENYLFRIAFGLLYGWGLAQEAIPVLEFMAERYPSSSQAPRMLVDGYVLVENYAAAIDVLSKFVQQNPDNAGARARLEEVRKLESRKSE
jgi:dienelactone hydrolase